jgi:LPLT family lysophospholipid transporter-like MFS transporter
VLGGALIKPEVSGLLRSTSRLSTPPSTRRPKWPCWSSALLYLIAALFNLYIPDTGVDHKPLQKNPVYLIHEFWHCLKLLWRDKLGQISLAVTTLFWGAGATLQFIVLEVGRQGARPAARQGHACCRAWWRSASPSAHPRGTDDHADKSVKVLPVGMAMGVGVIVMIACASCGWRCRCWC